MLVFISRPWYELTSSCLLEIGFFFWGKNLEKKDFVNQAFSNWICKRFQFWSFKEFFIHLNPSFFRVWRTNGISHFSKGNKNTNHTKWNTHSHSEDRAVTNPPEDYPHEAWKETLPNTNRPQRQIHVRTDCQHTQIKLSAHKGSLSARHTCKNQSAKNAQRALHPSKEKLAGCTLVDLLCLGAHQLSRGIFPFRGHEETVGGL